MAMNDDRSRARPLGRVSLDSLGYAAAVLAGLVLAAIMILTVADVTLRFVAEPIYGSQEISELGMVAIIMFALPYCTITDGHIRVDLMDERLGDGGRRATDLFGAALGVVVLGFLVWNTAEKVITAYQYADDTGLLHLPIWPLYLLIALSMAFYGLVVLRSPFRRAPRSADRSE